ncbi:MAG TPA: maleylpyruvate isomerase family mycothiol-dependent enzyme [Streptosporangiaceae bacterium]|nr:maleylpyruvate isomerase family mycothiol-dependent enzyme [Streptosporangiaceae bacterium]
MTTADRDPAALPAGLRERVMTASLLARGAGQPVPAVPAISGAEAFGRAADAFYELLAGLDEQDWARPALRDLDVQGLTGHLIGVEEDMQRGLAGDPAVAGADHVESTQDPAIRQASRSPALTMRDWRRAADRTLAEARSAGTGAGTEADGGRIAVHGMRLPLDDLLVVRAFELWVHGNDIRRCAGLAPSVPDPPVLRLMSDLAARMLPYAAARTGLRERVDVHLVLTGPGGGTWDVTVGQQPEEQEPDGQGPGHDVAIVTDAVGFCRLAANRTTPAELGPHVTGDAGRAAEVLAATSMLALD